jgi:DNA replication protein DnaC
MSNETLMASIDVHLRALRLPGALSSYRELRTGEEGLRFLHDVLQAEITTRYSHRLERNLRTARFPMPKELAAFDFSAIPSLNKSKVDDLVKCSFIPAKESVLLVGNPGTGKTHLLISLGLEAIRRGYRVRFVAAAGLVNELLLARNELRVPRLLRFYAGFDLVLVDELGYVPFSRDGAQLLYEFFSDRYERRATALTTNLPFAQWPQIFGDETMTVALIDRLTHRSHVLLLNGESYRLRQSRQAAAKREPPPAIPKVTPAVIPNDAEG